jgi:hypothetical protein
MRHNLQEIEKEKKKGEDEGGRENKANGLENTRMKGRITGNHTLRLRSGKTRKEKKEHAPTKHGPNHWLG